MIFTFEILKHFCTCFPFSIQTGEEKKNLYRLFPESRFLRFWISGKVWLNYKKKINVRYFWIIHISSRWPEHIFFLIERPGISEYRLRENWTDFHLAFSNSTYRILDIKALNSFFANYSDNNVATLISSYFFFFLANSNATIQTVKWS